MHCHGLITCVVYIYDSIHHMKKQTLYSASRVAFKMKLKPGFKEEYIRRHAEIWPDLAGLLHKAGVHDYSIFLDEETNILFAVQKVSDESGSQDLGREIIVKKWWKYMSDIMETNPDYSPVTVPLTEVFYMQ